MLGRIKLKPIQGLIIHNLASAPGHKTLLRSGHVMSLSEGKQPATSVSVPIKRQLIRESGNPVVLLRTKRGHSKNQKGPFTMSGDGKGPVP